MEINGLPLHVLAVHAAVVFGPLSAAAALAYVALPKWRDRLRWVTLAAVLIGFGAIWVAYLSGENFLENGVGGDKRFDSLSGEALAKIEKHEDYAETLRLVVSGFTLVTCLAIWQHQRTGAARVVLNVLVAVGAVATLVYTILTGDAGAQAVWSQ